MGNFFSRENVARVGSVAIPFPFSAILGVLAIPVLLLAALVSIPVTAARQLRERRDERRIAENLRVAGRTTTWAAALAELDQGRGSLVNEYLALKGPVRLWFTSDIVVEASPHPCCLELLPWGDEDEKLREFFEWCRSRYADLKQGSALLVEVPALARGEFMAGLEQARAARRYVSIAAPAKVGQSLSEGS